MSYVTPPETAATSGFAREARQALIRKTTESQGARSTAYEVKDATGKWIPWQRADRARSPVSVPRREIDLAIAQREHVARLLRECRRKGEELLEAGDDPIQSALIGADLTRQLQELWTYRRLREADWVELLNLLQLVLAKQEFESLSREKRETLVAVLRDCVSPRTIDRSDLARTLRTLSAAGFDVWRGVREWAPPD